MGIKSLVKNYVILFTTLGLLYYLLDIWLALFISIVFAYSIYPFADLICLGISKTGLKKETSWNIASSIAFILFLVLILLLVLLLIPSCIHQIQVLTSFLKNIRVEELWAQCRLLPFYENVDIQTLITLIKPHLNKIIDTGINQLASIAHHLTQNSGTLVMSFFSSFHNLFYSLLVLALSFHLLRDRFQWERRLHALLSHGRLLSYKARVLNSVNIFVGSMKHMITGQVILSSVMSIYYGLSFLLLGFSPLLGFVFGFASIIPYIGDAIAFSLLLFDALSRGFILSKFIIILVLIGVGHNICSHLLSPILIGTYTGVLPVQILFGLMLHVHLLGTFGLLFNIPLCILGRSIFAFWRSDLIGDKNQKSS